MQFKDSAGNYDFGGISTISMEPSTWEICFVAPTKMNESDRINYSLPYSTKFDPNGFGGNSECESCVRYCNKGCFAST